MTEQEGRPPPGDARKKKPPSSFSRIFLGGLQKYQKTASRADVGSVTEEAAANLAQDVAPQGQRAGESTIRLRSPKAIFETAAITVLIPAIGFLIDRSDPFFLEGAFSWLVFAPLLVGLRHGFAPGCASALALDVAIVVSWRTGWVPIARFPSQTVVGLVALAMLCGQFSDVWKREIVRLDAGFTVVRRQINELMRANFLIELSHDRLLEQQGRGTPNLKDALETVRRLAPGWAAASLYSIGEPVMQLLASYCMIESASLLPIQNGRVAATPVAMLGKPHKVLERDPLVVLALETGDLAYLPTGASPRGKQLAETTRLLAAVPLVDAHGTMHGLLCVEEMPFIAFERRNLQTLAIVCGHVADLLRVGQKGASAQEGRRAEFELRVARAIRDLRLRSIPSHVFGLLIRKGSPMSDAVESLMSGVLGELDFPLVMRDWAENYIVFILLPMSDEAALHALHERVKSITSERLGVTVQGAGAFTFTHPIAPDDTVEGVMKALETKAHIDEAAARPSVIV